MSFSHTGDYLGIPASGRRVTITGVDLARISDGKVAEIRHQEDILGLMEHIDAIPRARTSRLSHPSA